VTQPTNDRWLLPDGVDELLPAEAWQVEQLRRNIVDCCQQSGFDLVMPPIVEYLDSLLTGTGETMDLQTFKLVDQSNGRSLGVRADMTPQVARMDAHALRTDKTNRLFYTGTVLRARTDGFGGSRSPFQFGAELFGHAGAASDVEVIRLMLAAVSQTDLSNDELLLDLGHVGVYRGLLEQLHLNDTEAQTLFKYVQRGSIPDVQNFLQSDLSSKPDSGAAARLVAFMNSRGDADLILQARESLAQGSDMVGDALSELQSIVTGVRETHPEIKINIDLAELRGYRYHTGVLFTAYTHDGVELARGGRYDAVGAAFGHARPATGFSGDLKKLAAFCSDTTNNGQAIFVSADSVSTAWSEIVRLRAAGERVVTALDDENSNDLLSDCNRQLIASDGRWELKPLKSE